MTFSGSGISPVTGSGSGRRYPVAPPLTFQVANSSVAPGISNSVSFGAEYTAVALHPASKAAANPTGFIEEPTCLPLPTARFTFASSSSAKKSRPPTIARTKPVWGSMTITEASGSPIPPGRCRSTAASASD